MVEVVDRRDDDIGRSGLFSDRLVRRCAAGGRVVCVLNRKGRARLLACAALRRDGPLRACATRRSASRRRPRCACRAVRHDPARGVPRTAAATALQEPAARRDPGARGAGGAGRRAGGRGHAPRPDGRRVPTRADPRRHRGGAAPGRRGRRGGLPRLRPGAAGAALPGRRGGARRCSARAARLVGGRARAAGGCCVQTRAARPRGAARPPSLGDPARVAAAERPRRAAARLPAVRRAGRGRRARPRAGVRRRGFGQPDGVEVLGPSDDQWLLRAADRDGPARRAGRHAPPAGPAAHRRRSAAAV